MEVGEVRRVHAGGGSEQSGGRLVHFGGDGGGCCCLLLYVRGIFESVWVERTVGAGSLAHGRSGWIGSVGRV